MKRSALGMIAIVLLAGAAPAALAAEQQSSAYAGSTVSFDVKSNALVDYSVGGTTVVESIQVQSKSETDSALGLGGSIDLGAVVNISGASLSLQSSADTRAAIRVQSGATLRAHDNGHGSLVVESGEQAQYVEVGLGAEASATAKSDSRVVVTTAEGTKGAFVVTGEGSVTVNEQGNVTAKVGAEGRLVFRTYPDGRSEAEARTEALIANETAAASVYLTGNGTDVVNYDSATSISVSGSSHGNVTMTVSRSSHDGKVIVTSVAESTFESAEDIQVSVNGSAAVRASSYSELTAATNGGATSKFMVQNDAQASASADVLVAVNHFSTRQVTMSDESGTSDGSGGAATDGGTADGGESTADGNDATDGTNTTSGSGPGFGAVGALLAVGLSVAALAHRRD